jgi:hypothetical protein
VVPTPEEVVDHGSAVGVPAEFCREWHDAKTAGRYWFNRRGELIDWRFDLRSRWTKTRHTWKPPASAVKSADELRDALMALPKGTPERALAETAYLEAKWKEEGL